MNCLKSMFNRSKNALTLCPGSLLNLIPGVGLILLIEMQCAHARMLEDRHPQPAPLLYAVGSWEITKSSGASSLVKRPQ
jgi:hypothetical protein